jgi:hypothetical protein
MLELCEPTMSTNIQTFYDRLRRAKTTLSAGQEADRARLRAEWVGDIEQLFETLHRWLQPGVDEGLLTVERGTIELSEESLGTYTAPTLTIHLPGEQRIRLEPFGVEVLGGFTGRIDLLSGPNKARLFRGPQRTWKLALPSVYSHVSLDLAPLTQDAFMGALDQLTA